MFLGKKFKATKFVNRQTLNIQSKLAVYFTISHSKSILLISSNKIASSLLCMKRVSKYMSFKIEILLIPLLQAISHIFEISVGDHPLNIVGDRRPRSLMNFRLG
jgi:hypothetical protein